MKKTLLIIAALMLFVGCSKPINDKNLIDKDGLKYHPDTKKLYSGKVFKNRIDGKKEFEGSYKNGGKNGKWTSWYENGQKKDEENYKYLDKYGDPIRNGKRITWFENGQKSSEVTYKEGKLISDKCCDEDGNETECTEPPN